MSKGREILEQRLAWMVAIGTAINTTAGTLHTEWVKSETFSGGIAPFASDKEEGAMEVKKHTDEVGKLSFWMDGLKLNSAHIEA